MKNKRKIMGITLAVLAIFLFPQEGMGQTDIYDDIVMIKEEEHMGSADIELTSLTGGDNDLVDFSSFVPDGTKYVYLKVTFEGDFTFVDPITATFHLYPPRLGAPISDFSVGLTVYCDRNNKFVDERGFLEIDPNTRQARYQVENVTPGTGTAYITVLGYASNPL